MMDEKQAIGHITRTMGQAQPFADDFDSGDPWGSVMAHFFAVATVLYLAGEDIPPAWHFKPGGLVACDDLEWPDSDYKRQLDAGEVSADGLRLFGNLLNGYASTLEEAGMSY